LENDNVEDVLANYYALVDKVDGLCRQIETEFADQLACNAGCSGCCRHISLSWVEAVALATALHRLPPNEAEEIRLRAQSSRSDGPCPLLADDRCALYRDRPIICRTHGLPVLTETGAGKAIDFCPHNFKGLDSLPGTAVVDLERLNTLLDSVNRLFVSRFFEISPNEERLSIAEALLLEIDSTGDPI
jgi:Fe-S-cluster containining protein